MFFCHTQTQKYFNDICDEIRLFFPIKKINRNAGDNKTGIYHNFTGHCGEWVSSAELWVDGVKACEDKRAFNFQSISLSRLNIKKYQKRLIKQNIYWLLKNYTLKPQPWGSLTGIRPVKLARELADEYGVDKVKAYLKDNFDVSENKISLAFDIIQEQKKILKVLNADNLLVYIGIPFCPTRCKYCSFISHDIKRAFKYQDLYVDALLKEMCLLSDCLRSGTIKSLYIGGGTPSALSDKNFECLLATTVRLIPEAAEFTVECGRPDTITRNKLKIMREYGVNRISINPQTLNQNTLNLIGRQHTAHDFYNAFDLARKYEFNNINTDIIIGLPQETEQDVYHTVNELLKIQPENITVHTLAIKNASTLSAEGLNINIAEYSMENIIEEIRDRITCLGYAPYYLYRQKYMSGNLENTGYAKPGYDCVYNIGNMEEIVSVLAFGCGSISKKLYAGNRIERYANSKDIENYIARFAEFANAKRALFC